jgi:hypothetical protein
MRRHRATALLSAAASLVLADRADAGEPAAESQPQADIQGPPSGMEQVRRLHDDDLARKKEGGYFTGLPLANYDHDIGFGLGARLYYYDNGKREDPLFAYTPYLQRVFAQGFVSSGGVQYHWLFPWTPW